MTPPSPTNITLIADHGQRFGLTRLEGTPDVLTPIILKDCMIIRI